MIFKFQPKSGKDRKGGMSSWKRRLSLSISKFEAHEDAERKGFAEGVVKGEFAAGDFVVIGILSG